MLGGRLAESHWREALDISKKETLEAARSLARVVQLYLGLNRYQSRWGMAFPSAIQPKVEILQWLALHYLCSDALT